MLFRASTMVGQLVLATLILSLSTAIAYSSLSRSVGVDLDQLNGAFVEVFRRVDSLGNINCGRDQ